MMCSHVNRFQTVDKVWRETMAAVAVEPNVIRICTSRKKLLDSFVESNKLLDLIQKGLNDYLETKRAFFPRLYFLSNDELLEILSQTRYVLHHRNYFYVVDACSDPKAVIPFLKKCFENIFDIEFKNNPTMDICAMFSAERERIALDEVLIDSKPDQTYFARLFVPTRKWKRGWLKWRGS